MENFIGLFDSASQMTGYAISEIELDPIHMNGSTYLCGIKKYREFYLLLLKTYNKFNGVMSEANETIWMSPQCFADDVLDRAYKDFKKCLEECKEPIILSLQYRIPGNCALQEEYVFFSNKKAALKASVKKRSVTEGLKSKFIKINANAPEKLTKENFFKPIESFAS